MKVAANPQSQMVQLSLDNAAKVREFAYDRVFGPDADQDAVYNEVGGPIVADVLAGYNGTILAYGQTGTGKTYTMGILNRVRDEHNGLIPRALGHIFGHIAQHGESDWIVSMSFLQIYLETVQDLFSTTLTERDENLTIREDPQTGFYVEGLQEYEVRNFDEAVELLNWGLENRVMGCTKMNATSSRSHTVLTVAVGQRGESSRARRGDDADSRASAGAGGPDERPVMRTLRGKLVLVDLAGSERVRRTTSKGTRLVEAKSINVSLSALGNVIAALADHRSQHVPYRDSKLTRLLQDNLGGKASTYLVATIGPARMNDSETQSTLQFASRCMRVAANPVVNEELDYADLCAHLQAQVAGMESKFLKREAAHTEKYEKVVRELMSQIEDMQGSVERLQREKEELHSRALVARVKGGGGGGAASVGTHGDSESVLALLDGDGDGVLERMYAILCALYHKSAAPIRDCVARSTKQSQEWNESADREGVEEDGRAAEEALMAREDPDAGKHTGRHLNHISRPTARARVGGLHHFGAAAAAAAGGEADGRRWPMPPVVTPDIEHPPLSAFSDRESLVSYVEHLKNTVLVNLNFLSEMLATGDAYYNLAKEELVEQTVERRRREEEMVNWSYVLKYLLDTNSQLRGALKAERRAMSRAVAGTSAHPSYSGEAAADASDSDSAAAKWPASPTKARSQLASKHEPEVTTLRRVRARSLSSDLALPTVPANATVSMSTQPLRKMAERQARQERYRGAPAADPTAHTLLAAAPSGHGDRPGAPPLPPPVASSQIASGGIAAVAQHVANGSGVYGHGVPTSAAASSSAQSDSFYGTPSHAAPGGVPVAESYPGAPAYAAAPPAAAGGLAALAASSSPPIAQAAEAHPPVADDGGATDVVERIVQGRASKKGFMYKVHWAGTSDAEDEWFSRDDLLASFPQVVEEFEAGARHVAR